MNILLEKLKEQATYNERGHGAFGESEKWQRLDEDLFAELIIEHCISIAEEVVGNAEGVTFGLGEEIRAQFGIVGTPDERSVK